MLSAMSKPSVVPRAIAPSRFSFFSASTSSSLITTRPAVFGTSVSGTSIFAIRSVPGAVMMTALSKCFGSIPKAIYAAMIPPETCAMPLVITVINSERVRSGKKRPNGLRGFRLAHENAGGHIQRLRAARSHQPRHQPRRELDDELHDSEVIKHRKKRADENHRWQNLKCEIKIP